MGSDYNIRTVSLSFLPLLLGAAQLLAADSGIIAPGAGPQKIAESYSFTEGPASDRDGNVFFTDQPNDRILKWTPGGDIATWMQPAGRANGLCFDAQGNLWACADETNALWRIHPDKSIDVLVKNYQGKLLNGPNDVWLTPSGDAYFTDPYYKRPYWKRGEKEIPECVYFLSTKDGKLTRVVDDMKQPNGIIGAPDGKTLYIADIGGKKTYRYAIQPAGALDEKKLFCEMGSDGMTIDNEGNVYLTGKGVTVFAPSGKQIEHIDIQEPWTANVCFGGKDARTLFITASKCVYTLQMRVKGAGSQ